MRRARGERSRIQCPTLASSQNALRLRARLFRIRVWNGVVYCIYNIVFFKQTRKIDQSSLNSCSLLTLFTLQQFPINLANIVLAGLLIRENREQTINF